MLFRSELEDGKVRVGERIPGGYIFVEGSSVSEADPDVLREREQLAQAGVFFINLNIDKNTHRLLSAPEIITHGFVSADEDAQAIAEAVQKRVVEVISVAVGVTVVTKASQ